MQHFGDWPSRWAGYDRNRLAMIDVDRGISLTYGELAERIARYTTLFLEEFDIVAGERVAVLALGSSEVFAIQFACYRLGAIFTPLNWRLSGAELTAIIDDADPSLLIYDAAMAKVVRSVDPARRALNYHQLSRKPLPPARDIPPHRLEGDDLAMLLYTSGTTGRAKGAMLSHGQLFYNALNTLQACDLRQSDRVLAFLPLFHTGGLNCLAGPILYRGGVVVIMARFDAQAALDVMAKESITLAIAVPTMYRMLLEAGLGPQKQWPHLRMFLCGGAPCPQSLMGEYWQLGYDFRQGFGMTEVGPNCFSLGHQGLEGRLQSVGKAAFHGEARIVKGGKTAGPHVVGGLQLRGPHVMQGYWKRPDITEKSFDDAWFITGDLAYYDEAGFYYIVGREKDMYISGGENVYPAEIERVLSGHPGVKEACVMALSDEKWGEVGLAAIELRPGHGVDEMALRRFCQSALARYKVPKYFYIMGELPRNASGKALKAEIKVAWQSQGADGISRGDAT